MKFHLIKEMLLDPGQDVQIEKRRNAGPFTALASIKEPVVQRGPFVMNTEAEYARHFLTIKRPSLVAGHRHERSPVHPRMGHFADMWMEGRN
ncbi:MAG: hypothetical protein U5K79_07780 [Cyclobacteriaceae bacterium]|nr:hypothetical protein [Cyclobacteriaceae bacterium]